MWKQGALQVSRQAKHLGTHTRRAFTLRFRPPHFSRFLRFFFNALAFLTTFILSVFSLFSSVFF